jgi:hypothetical protein
MVAVCFAMTLLLEVGFVALSLPKGTRSLARVLCATIVVNVVSYAGLAAMYWGASGHSLLSETTRDSSLTWVAPQAHAWVYYIDEKTDTLARIRPDGSGLSAIPIALPAYSIKFSREQDIIGGFLAAKDEGDGTFTIRSAVAAPDELQLEGLKIVAGPIRGRVAGSTFQAPNWDPNRIPDVFLHAQSFRTSMPAREIRVGFWAGQGVVVHEGGRLVASVAWEMPFEAWKPRSATELPDGLIVYQLGTSQIAIFDPLSKTIGLVARGRCPVVVIEDEEPPPP